jgi:hypothetical protein
MKSSLRFGFLTALAVLAICGLAFAQDQSPDPPGRVARLQFIQGQVSLQPGGVDDWIDASMNRPLTTADRIWSDVNSRTELTTGSAVLRLGTETGLTLTNLSDNAAQMELDQGTMNLSVRSLNPGETIEIDTPNFAFTVLQPGEYLFNVMPDQDQSWILVRRGDGEASGVDSSVDLPGGVWYRFSHGQSLQYTTARVPGRDEFEQWCAQREMVETASPSARYVAAGTVGYEALDGNGIWQPSPIYGSIWFPNVAPGWAPYHAGHWAWVEPWGWTWVDDAPWGFAPFHYGRWVVVDGRWGWVPGPMGVRPVYAPALVAWVGGVSIGIGGGGVAWVPLGWHDPFIPSYPVSVVYARNVNLSNSRMVNVTVINNYYSTTNVQARNTIIVNNIHYENVTVHGAVTGVPANAFASGRPVAQAAVVVPAGAMGHASFVASAAIVPTKAAVLGGHAPAMAPSRLVTPRQVVARMAPPARPLSFEQQRPLLEKSGGVPLSPAVRANLRASSPAPAGARVMVVPARPAVAPAAVPAHPASALPVRPAAAPAPAPAVNAERPAYRPAPTSGVPAAAPARPATTAPQPPAPPAPAEARPAIRPAPATGGTAAPPPQKKTPPPPPKKKDEKEHGK